MGGSTWSSRDGSGLRLLGILAVRFRGRQLHSCLGFTNRVSASLGDQA